MIEYAMGLTLGQRGAARSASLAPSVAVVDGTRHANLVEDLNERVERPFVVRQAM